MLEVTPVTDSPRVHSSTTVMEDGKVYVQDYVVCAGQPPEAVSKIYAYAARVGGDVDEVAWHPENKPPLVAAFVVYEIPDRKLFH